MRAGVLIVVLAVSTAPALAQVHSRPTDPPLVTAANESWYQMREPLQFAGDVYYPAGAARFFNGNVMVRAGHYNGVPLYVDATVEPYSLVFVPVSRGLMQPYERLRRGDLAGTTGSRTPSFPVEIVSGAAMTSGAASSPTALPLSPGAIGVFTPLPPTLPVVELATTAAVPGAPLARPSTVATLLTPENNDGIWVHYRGERWVSAGKAVPFEVATFSRVGVHGDLPVYMRALNDDLIYVPALDGLVAPYRLKR